MKIDLVIDGKTKTFTTPFVPMLARRKYFELMSKIEDSEEETPTHQQLLDEEDELNSILSDIVFSKQFTLEQLYAGASKQYADEKLNEAISGKIKSEKGNEKGE
ncbi:hypothetical protein GI584_14240 [Gracilibacillus salitolerans]|uniref:Phage protein n=1 Tax=Gracilibacillus salitolerans TaxID=2663022 RepID=A0A5Q2TM22_9BACI|nr:hypothetical protein [Gracilibacillus salitolerans]QGH35132.1 hypothetical protein GI584_14240 [Gracilibacillus salitolerans]